MHTKNISLWAMLGLSACLEEEEKPNPPVEQEKEDRESLLPDDYVLTASSTTASDFTIAITEDTPSNTLTTATDDVETMFNSWYTIAGAETFLGVLLFDNEAESFEGTW